MLFALSSKRLILIAGWGLFFTPFAAIANLSRYQLTAVTDGQLDSSNNSVATNQPLSYVSDLIPGNSVFVQSDYGLNRIQIATTRVDRPNTEQGFGTVSDKGSALAWSEWLETFVMSGGAFGTKGHAVFQTQIDGYISQAAQAVHPYARLNLAVEGLDASFSGGNAVTYERIFSEEENIDSATWSADSFANNILTKSFEFTYGVPFSVYSVLSATAKDGGQVTYQNTVRAGFVLGPNQVLTAFSGTSYPELTAVPLPPAFWLFASSLMIGSRLRKTNSQI